MIAALVLITRPVPAAAAGPPLPTTLPPAFGSIADLATDPVGNLYVLDGERARVVRLTRDGGPLDSWGGRGSRPGRFKGVSSIAIGPSGDVYVLDGASDRVEVFSRDGDFLRQWRLEPGGEGHPQGIAVGADGRVYVAGTGYEVAVLDGEGRRLDTWTDDWWGPKERQATGDPDDVRPIDVAVGPSGDVFVLDSYRGIDRYTPDGTWIAEFTTPNWWLWERDTAIAVSPTGLVAAASEGTALWRLTSRGKPIDAWGFPADWYPEDGDLDPAEVGYQGGLEEGVHAVAFGPDGATFVGGHTHVFRYDPPPSEGRADAGRSEFGFADGAPRLVPADDASTTSLVAMIRNAAGDPIVMPDVRVMPTSDWSGQEAACEPGERPGEVDCDVRGPDPGPQDFELVDVATGAVLGKPAHVEFTRKVVVLVQGFNSALKKRFCYWGPTNESGRQDCESDRKRVLADPGGVYGKLAGLGYQADANFGDPGATILDVSWDLVPCGDRECVAEIGHKGGDVTWTPKAYDIGGIRGPTSVSRQLGIDRYAAALVESLKRYDQALADPHKGIGAHATFNLVGHSMGGELVVRALNAALADPYFTDPMHRGLVRAVISVDGALNWANTFLYIPGATAIPYPDLGTFASKLKGVRHCGIPVYTNPSAAKETENANAVQLAHELMGTRTIALTNGNDWVVPYDPELVELPVALLESPVKPKPGYGKRLFWGYGAGDAGDPDCGHSTLLREQPDGVYTSDRWDDKGATAADYRAKSMFPLGDLIVRFVGPAVR